MAACCQGLLALGWRCSLAVLLALSPSMAHAQAPATGGPAGEMLLDRTVAVVGGAVVTQSDVDLAVALGLVAPSTDGRVVSTTGAVIDRWLMLHEVARFSPAEPDPAAVGARLAAVRVHIGGEDALAAALVRGGFTEARLTGWLRDDLRITAYLDQRFASAGVPSEGDVTAYVETHRAALEQSGVAPADLARVARERLVAERRRDLIGDWLGGLRGRTEVVEFTRRPG